MTDVFVCGIQNAAQRQAEPSESCEEHPGWRAPQQVPVPQHDGAQRAGQEDRDDSGHRECTEQQTGASVSSALPSFNFLLPADPG